jgi:hypothetical protein
LPDNGKTAIQWCGNGEEQAEDSKQSCDNRGIRAVVVRLRKMLIQDAHYSRQDDEQVYEPEEIGDRNEQIAHGSPRCHPEQVGGNTPDILDPEMREDYFCPFSSTGLSRLLAYP